MPTKFKLLAGLNTAFLLFLSLSLFAQTSITGRVLSNTDKKPVVGATVQVKGGKSATLTGSGWNIHYQLISKSECTGNYHRRV